MDNEPRLLAVFAHPDDESCGPGGTLAKYASEGVNVSLVCFTHGERGAYGLQQRLDPGTFGTIRVSELSNACAALGLRHLSVLGYPDGALLWIDQKQRERDLVQFIRRIRPHVVLTLDYEGPDGHPDHSAVRWTAGEAFLDSGDPEKYPEQLAEGLEPFSPQKLYAACPLPVQQDQDAPAAAAEMTILDVAKYVPARVKAIQCHLSQEYCWQNLLKGGYASRFSKECFRLVKSRISPAPRERDFFAGLALSKPMLVETAT